MDFRTVAPSGTSPETVVGCIGNRGDKYFKATLGAGNNHLKLTDFEIGDKVTIRVTQDSTGSRVMNFANLGGGATISWVGGAAPALQTKAGATDTFTFTKISDTSWYGESPVSAWRKITEALPQVLVLGTIATSAAVGSTVYLSGGTGTEADVGNLRPAFEVRVGSGTNVASGTGALMANSGTLLTQIDGTGSLLIGSGGIAVGAIDSALTSAEFYVQNDGTVGLNSVPYTFPAADGAGTLTSNGAGALSWASISTFTYADALNWFVNVGGDTMTGALTGTDAAFSGTIDGSGALTIEGATQLKGTAAVTGAMTAASISASGDLTVTGDIRAGSGVILTPDAITYVSTGATILSTGSTILRVSGAATSTTLSTTPSIADGVDGQIIIVEGTHDVYTVTFKDESTLAASGLQLAGGANFVAGSGDVLMLMYDALDDNWYEISRSDN